MSIQNKSKGTNQGNLDDEISCNEVSNTLSNILGKRSSHDISADSLREKLHDNDDQSDDSDNIDKRNKRYLFLKIICS